jgi:hypothetical protein
MTPLAKNTDRFTQAGNKDEIVLMLVETGEFLSLSGTAAAAWKMIDGSRDRDCLVRALAAEFGEEKGRIGPEIDEFLEELRRRGLVSDA